MALGLASNIPRVVLYFLLVPAYGVEGAAISYTIGAVIGLISSLFIAKKIGMQIFWKDLAIILFIPTTLSYFLSYFSTNIPHDA